MHRQPHVIALAQQLGNDYGTHAIKIASERLLSAIKLGSAEDQNVYLAVCRLMSAIR